MHGSCIRDTVTTGSKRHDNSLAPSIVCPNIQPAQLTRINSVKHKSSSIEIWVNRRGGGGGGGGVECLRLCRCEEITGRHISIIGKAIARVHRFKWRSRAYENQLYWARGRVNINNMEPATLL